MACTDEDVKLSTTGAEEKITDRPDEESTKTADLTDTSKDISEPQVDSNEPVTTSASTGSGPAVSSNNEEATATQNNGNLPEKKETEAGSNDQKPSGENGSSNGSKPNRTAPQPTKRRPDKELNHDNWDQEDEPEEKGEFVKATEEKLKERKILTAKRKQKSASQTSSNPFGAINFGNTFGNSSNNVSSMFNFATAQSKPTPVPTFDFSSVSSTKKDDCSENDSKSSKKLRKEESETPSVTDPEGATSATTV